MSYADNIALPPRTLTEGEQRALLKVSGDHARGFRDHVIFSVALGTALREHEILALNVGDVFGPDGKSRRRVQLRVFKRSNDDDAMQEAVLPDNLRAKLDKFRGWKKRRGEALDTDAPGFGPVVVWLRDHVAGNEDIRRALEAAEELGYVDQAHFARDFKTRH